MQMQYNHVFYGLFLIKIKQIFARCPQSFYCS